MEQPSASLQRLLKLRPALECRKNNFPVVVPSEASANEGQPFSCTFNICHRQLVASLEIADRDFCTGVAQKLSESLCLRRRNNRIVCSRSHPNANGREVRLRLGIQRNHRSKQDRGGQCLRPQQERTRCDVSAVRITNGN